jgi:hypothetical protein
MIDMTLWYPNLSMHVNIIHLCVFGVWKSFIQLKLHHCIVHNLHTKVFLTGFWRKRGWISNVLLCHHGFGFWHFDIDYAVLLPHTSVFRTKRDSVTTCFGQSLLAAGSCCGAGIVSSWYLLEAHSDAHVQNVRNNGGAFKTSVLFRKAQFAVDNGDQINATSRITSVSAAVHTGRSLIFVHILN